MDLELKNLGQTIAIGGLAIYSVVALLRFYFPRLRILFFRSSDKKIQIQEAAVYLALVFAVGIVIEGVAKNMVADRDNRLTYYFEEFLVDKDKELRLRNLFKVNASSKSKIKITETSISQSFYKIKNRPSTIEPHLTKLRNIFEEKQGCRETPHNEVLYQEITVSEDEVGLLKDAANEIYYVAKNSAFRDGNYFKELSEISLKIDFTRSLTLLCFIFFLLYFLSAIFSLFYLIKRFFKRNQIINLKFWIPALKFFKLLKRLFKANRVRGFRMMGLSLIFLLGTYLAARAYKGESTNYNLRVFGYYISLKAEEK